MSQQPTPICASCGKPAPLRCTGCRVERYCSQACQRVCWPVHKAVCASLARTAAAITQPQATDAGSSNASAVSDSQGVSTGPAQDTLLPRPPAAPPPQPTPPTAPQSNALRCGFLLHRRRHVQPLQSASTAVLHAAGTSQQTLATSNALGPSSRDQDAQQAPPAQTPQPAAGTGTGTGPNQGAKQVLVPNPPSAPKPPPVPLQPSTAASTTQPPAQTTPTQPAATLARPLPFLRRGFLQQASAAKAATNTSTHSSVIPTASTPTTGPNTAKAVATNTHVSASVPEGASQSGLHITALPTDMLCEILTRVSARTLARCRLVCREWGTIASWDLLWRPFVHTHGIRLPTHTLTHNPHTQPHPQRSSSANSSTQRVSGNGVGISVCDGDRRPSPPTGPKPPGHLVAGVQSVRALRAALTHTAAATHTVTHTVVASQPPPLSVLVGAALKQRDAWETARYAEYQLQLHSGTVECLAIIDTPLWGSVLISGGWDGAVRLSQLWPRGRESCGGGGGGAPAAAGTSFGGGGVRWLVGTRAAREPVCVREYQGAGGCVTSMAAGRECVITGSTGRVIAMWRYSDARPAPASVIPHTREVTLVRFAYAHSETLVLAGCAGGTLGLWDMLKRQQLRQFTGQTESVWGCGRLPSLHFVTGSRDGSVCVWQLPQLQRQTTTGQASTTATARAAAAGPSHTAAAAAGTAGTASTASTFHDRAVLDARNTSPRPSATTTATRDRWESVIETDMHVMQLHASGRSLPSDVIMLDSSTTRTVPALPTRSVSSNSSTGGFMHGDHVYRVEGAHALDSQTGSSTISGSNSSNGMAINTNGSVYQHGSMEGRSNAPTGPMQTLQSHTGPVLCMDVYMHLQLHGAWGPRHACCFCTALPHAHSDAQAQAPHTSHALVATGGADSLINVYSQEIVSGSSFEVASLQSPLHRLRGHSHGVLSLRFCCLPRLSAGERGGSSRRVVLVSGAVREVKIWDPYAGVCLTHLSDHRGPITSIAVSHDHIATLAMGDGLMVYSCQGVASEPSSKTSPDKQGARDSNQAKQRVVLKPVLSLIGAEHRFQAALLACSQVLAVGHGTGAITLLDFSCRSTVQRC